MKFLDKLKTFAMLSIVDAAAAAAAPAAVVDPNNIESMFTAMREAGQAKIEKIDAELARIDARLRELVIVPASECTALIIQGLTGRRDGARKSFESMLKYASVISAHADTKSYSSYSGGGFDIKPRGKSRVDLSFFKDGEIAMAMLTDEQIATQAAAMAVKFGCPETGASSAEMAAEQADLVNQMSILHSDRYELEHRLERLMTASVPAVRELDAVKKLSDPDVFNNGKFRYLKPDPGASKITITYPDGDPDKSGVTITYAADSV